MFSSPERKLTIYIDGSVTADNIGAVGIRIISLDESGDEVINDSQSLGHRNVNSGQIEIISCIEALEEAARLQLTLSVNTINIFTDSKYLSENYKAAMFDWHKTQWNTKAGRPIPDAHLWKDLVKVLQAYNKNRIFVDIQWVKGHQKNEHNLAVDKMARLASKVPLDKIPKNSPVTIFQPKKIPSIKRMEIGCVKMEGQKISIKILSCKLLMPQKIWCYGYEVISPNSLFKGLVDQVFSYISLHQGRSYFVKFNSVTENPRIEKCYREINS